MGARTRGLCAVIGGVAMLAGTPAQAGEPESAPGELPDYRVPIAAPLAEPEAEPEEPLRKVPPDGRGMQSVGSFALVGAALLGAGTVALALDGYGSDTWGSTMVLSGGATVAGSLLLSGGTRRQRSYRSWAANQAELPPAQGTGLAGAGSGLLFVGATAGVFGTVGMFVNSFGARLNGPKVSPVFPTVLGLGVASLGAGTATLVVGMQRHRRFQAWRRTPLELSPIVTPIPAPVGLAAPASRVRGPVGAQIGVVGRF